MRKQRGSSVWAEIDPALRWRITTVGRFLRVCGDRPLSAGIPAIA